MAKIAEIVEQHRRRALDVSVRYTARLGDSQGAVGKERNSLPFMPASAVRPGMVMVDRGRGLRRRRRASSGWSSMRPVYDLDIERTHNFIANGLVTHNSIYAFRGADIRNILEFERDFPNTKVIPLEQNYRSTNTILQAANDVISHNRDRKEKNLWSDLGDGEPVRVVETEDEHAEARFVAAEIARSDRAGLQRARDRRRLPHERAEPRARGRARPAGHRLPGDRRPEVLRARRDQGRDRVPAGARQPVRRRLADAHREPPAPRHRRHVDRAARRATPTGSAARSGRRWDASRRRASRLRRRERSEASAT